MSNWHHDKEDYQDEQAFLRALEHTRIIHLVRGDSHIGRGSCSCIDECLPDSELLDLINEMFKSNKKEVTDENILQELYKYHDDWISSLNYGDYTSPFEQLRINK